MACGPGTIAFAFDAVNPEAIAWVRSHAAELVTNVTAEARAAIRAVMERAFVEGIPPREAAKLIRGIVGLTEPAARAVTNRYLKLVAKGIPADKSAAMAHTYAEKLHRLRALVIARTETMAASNRGQQELWNQARAAGHLKGMMKVWLTTYDERTCAICGPMEGQTAEIEDDFGIPGPPAHPMCLPGDSLILPGALVAAASKRRFDGDLVVVSVTGGRELACTPHHPVLTPRGWLPAALLHVGSDVVCDGRRQWRGACDGDHEDVPARIEDVADAFFCSGEMVPVPVPTAAEDFHGDGVAGEVAVVWSDGLAHDDVEAALGEPVGELLLVGADGAPVPLTGRGGAAEVLAAASRPARRAVGGCDLVLPGGRRHARPFERLGLGLRARADAGLTQAAVDDVSTDSELARQLVDGRAGPVEVGHVLRVERVLFHGFVFNVETADGWFGAQGIITHNCRCTMGLVNKPRR